MRIAKAIEREWNSWLTRRVRGRDGAETMFFANGNFATIRKDGTLAAHGIYSSPNGLAFGKVYAAMPVVASRRR